MNILIDFNDFRREISRDRSLNEHKADDATAWCMKDCLERV